ncbi:MAG: ABC transporter permease [Nitriliruptorales bacterium]|nr:ABC transporter permease [Nitriliruptorales bacterium]
MGRLAFAPVFLFLLLTLLFILLRVMPGDPVTAALGDRLSPSALEARRAAAGLNDPILVQYGRYLAGVVQGDFGDAVTDPREVSEIVFDRFPATFELTMTAMLLAIAIGVVVGAIGARFRDTPLDVGGRLFGILIYAAPVFWLGILGQLLFASRWGLLPTGNRLSARITVEKPTGFYLLDSILTTDMTFFTTALQHLALPAITLGLVISGVFIRMVRVNMLQTLRADYVEAAEARGVEERKVVFRHAFRNALVPVVTIMGLQFALLLGGAILTETTFSWPGLGSALVEFINARDYAAVQGIVTFFALMVVFVSVAIDVINGVIDPRVRYS